MLIQASEVQADVQERLKQTKEEANRERHRRSGRGRSGRAEKI